MEAVDDYGEISSTQGFIDDSTGFAAIYFENNSRDATLNIRTYLNFYDGMIPEPELLGQGEYINIGPGENHCYWLYGLTDQNMQYGVGWEYGISYY